MQVVGVDACSRGRWAVVELDDGRFRSAVVCADFRAVLTTFSRAEAVAVDIPIGLPTASSWPRQADVEARTFVGAERSSSVFPTFPREVYEATSHSMAVELARSLVSRGLSIQSYGLGRRILEVESRLVGRVYEVHPEVSFRELAGRELASKKSAAGLAERRNALSHVDIVIPSRLVGAHDDDLLDAAAAAWTADRIARGEARSLPDPPERIDGRDVAIWF